MSCSAPCGFLDQQYKAAGFECNYIAQKFGADPVIESKWRQRDKKSLKQWLDVAKRAARIGCPMTINYQVRISTTRSSVEYAEIAMQYIFDQKPGVMKAEGNLDKELNAIALTFQDAYTEATERVSNTDLHITSAYTVAYAGSIKNSTLVPLIGGIGRDEGSVSIS